MSHSRSHTVFPSAFLLVLLCAIPAAAQTAWSTTMTVGVASDGSSRGYSEPFDYGALADDSFTVNGVTYTVTNLYYSLDGSPFGLSLSSSFAYDGWTLHVGDHMFHFDDATAKNVEFDGFPGYFFFWDHPGAFDGWTVGDEVSVSLVGPRSVPALPIPALGLLLALLIAVRKYAGKAVQLN